MQQAQAQEGRAQAQEQRAQQTFGMQQQEFTREQTDAEAKRLHGIFTDFLGPWAQGALASGDETAQRKYVADSLRNPAFRQRLEQANIYDSIDSIDPNDPNLIGELQMLAAVARGNRTGNESLPSSVQEWNYYNGLSKSDQQRYLEMKRSQQSWVRDVNEVPTVITAGTGGAPASTQSLSNLKQVSDSAGTVEGAKQREKEAAITAAIPGRAQAEQRAAADTKAAGARSALDLFDGADALIDKAPAGLLQRGVVAGARSAGIDNEAANAQGRLEALSLNVVLDRIKSFGSNPTEGERAALLASLGDLSNARKTRGERKAALEQTRAILRQIESRGSQAGGEVTATGPNGQGGPVAVNTPEEAARLPPGTKFRTPDGQVRVRH
jgi:hypothetical protein